MKAYCLIVGILLSLGVKAQIINSIAGGGSSLGDGGPATNATLSNPGGIVFDKSGNLYIVEGSGNRVRKLSNTGVISTVAGTGLSGYNGDGIPATSANLKNPFGIEIDSIGNLYIADCGNYRVRRVDAATGIISTVVGTGINGYNGDGIPATNAKITQPYDICFDKIGNLYITDNANYRIRKVNVSGIISTLAGTGILGSSGDGGPATAAQFTLIYGVKVDVYGNVYVADWNGGKVRKINTSGIITTIAGTGSHSYNGDNIQATNANIVPTRLALNSDGELYITDYTNYRIRKVDNFGRIHTVAGTGISGDSGDGGAATAAQLNGINGLAIDTCGNLYIASHFSRIRKVTFNPPPCTYLSVEEQGVKKEVSIYPNPANDVLHIENTTNTTYQLCNMVGAVMERGYLKEGSNSIAVQQLPPGLYMLLLTEEEGKRTVHKIVKE